MEEIREEKINQINEVKRSNQRKNKLIGFLFLIIIITIFSFWFYIQKTKVTIKNVKELNAAVQLLEQEKQRCSEVLNQTEGEFADYEYCKKLLQEFLK